MDSSFSTANPFKSKAADMSLLGSDISSEGGAPGSPMSGAMIDNPATSGSDIASSLFQSGLGEEAPAVTEASADASAVAPSPSGGSAASGAPAVSTPKGKLGTVASITAGNSSSMSSGGKHDKFFGSGNQKSEFNAVAPADMKKMAGPDKKSALVAMLSNSADKSSLAAKTGNADAAKGGAASAFANTAKAGGADLNSDFEDKSMEAGLQMGQTAQDLKKSDPSLSKNKITPPSAPEDATDESEEMKKEIMKMIIQALLKAALGMAGL
jgi:hypothetical protein